MPRPPLFFAAPFVLALFAFGTVPAAAQQEGGSYDRIAETNSTVAYFYHARAGVPTIQVSLWGTVPRPGIYEVAQDTELDQLLTMSGGAPAQPRTEGQEYEIVVRLFREQGGGREMIYEAPLEELLRDTEAYPNIQDEDVIVVETRIDEVLRWREVLGVVSSIGSLILLGDRLLFR